MSLQVGDQAPDFFCKTDGDGELFLQSLRGKKVVLYFYPKDMTPGCTTESEEFRDLFAEFEVANTVIIGASKDSVARHDKFKTQSQLPFTLVSDEDGALCEAYGVWRMKKLYGKEYMGIVRSTFLIDEKGVVQAVWDKVRVKGHVDAVLDVTKAF
ncbi:MAG: thioredoxin-dependent thiol peroxidase [Rhodospirillales bacterium]|nr:thioredoxin-dependent thiol peroxidase [Rhodospirillales bacterium]